MHVAQEFAEGHVMFEIKNVAKRVELGRVVVKHQQHPGKRQHDEEVERDAAHAPCKRVTHCVAIDLRGMQVQEDVRQNRERAVTRIGAIVGDAEDRLPELRILRIFVFLRLVDRALLEGLAALFHALDHAAIIFFARCELFFLVFWISVHLRQTRMYAPSSSKWLGSPFGHEESFSASTTIWPSASTETFARSIGRGAGPSKLMPSLS